MTQYSVLSAGLSVQKNLDLVLIKQTGEFRAFLREQQITERGCLHFWPRNLMGSAKNHPIALVLCVHLFAAEKVLYSADSPKQMANND